MTIKLDTRNYFWLFNTKIHLLIISDIISPPTLSVLILLRLGVLNATLCDQVCQWLAAGHWFSLDTLVASTNKTDRHNITRKLLKVALNTITPNPFNNYFEISCFTSKDKHKNVNSTLDNLAKFWKSVCSHLLLYDFR